MANPVGRPEGALRHARPNDQPVRRGRGRRGRRDHGAVGAGLGLRDLRDGAVLGSPAGTRRPGATVARSLLPSTSSTATWHGDGLLPGDPRLAGRRAAATCGPPGCSAPRIRCGSRPGRLGGTAALLHVHEQAIGVRRARPRASGVRHVFAGGRRRPLDHMVAFAVTDPDAPGNRSPRCPQPGKLTDGEGDRLPRGSRACPPAHRRHCSSPSEVEEHLANISPSSGSLPPTSSGRGSRGRRRAARPCRGLRGCRAAPARARSPGTAPGSCPCRSRASRAAR